MIDWHESPACVTSSPERTTFENAAGETFTLTRTGVEVSTRDQTASCDWARLQSLAITFPEYPNLLKWFAFVVRGALAGGPRAETVLEFAPAFPGFVWIIEVKFGPPARMWNLASRQFFATLDEVIPAAIDIQNPNLLNVYRQFVDVPILVRAFRSKSIIRKMMWPQR